MIWSRLIASLVWDVLVITLLLNEAVSCDDGRKSIPENFDYAAYVRKYAKSYDNVETLSRANLFYSRTLGILKANMQYISQKANYYLKQNQYTDMTHREMEQSLVSEDIDLTPVFGAALYPDTPADQFAEGINQDGIRDGYSRTASDEVTTQKSPINFFSNDETDSVDPRKLVREIVEHSDEAKRLARILELGKTREADRMRQTFRDENKVDQKAMVKPENVNYDPSFVPSLSWSEDVHNRANDFFADYLMEDFTGHLEPYPTPIIPTKRVLPDDSSSSNSGGILSELFQSVKTFYDFFSADDFFTIDDPISDELDTETTSVAKHEDAMDVDIPKDREKSKERQLIFDIDWRRTGCIPKPKSQSKCNSCYAFATLDLMEFFYCRQKKVSTEFSVQYVIDCGHKTGLNGCRGGKLSNVGMFIQKYGLQLTAAYPYNGLEHECPYDKLSDNEQKSWAFKPHISGWQMFPDIQAWYKWLPKSPIIVGINMPSDFLAYGGGIHDGFDCTPRMVHAMLLVGSGKEDGKPFWLLKNSFTEDWGEAGYFRLSKKAPIKCFNSAVVAKAKFHE